MAQQAATIVAASHIQEICYVQFIEQRPSCKARFALDITLTITGEIMKYDDASWHYGSDDFPEGQPEEHGGTHIALFLKWCFVKGWAGELHLQEEPEAVAAVVNGTLSATEFYFKYCDGKFIDDMLNAPGNAFASRYYGDDGLYLEDYGKDFGELMYVASRGSPRLCRILDDARCAG